MYNFNYIYCTGSRLNLSCQHLCHDNIQRQYNQRPALGVQNQAPMSLNGHHISLWSQRQTVINCTINVALMNWHPDIISNPELSDCTTSRFSCKVDTVGNRKQFNHRGTLWTLSTCESLFVSAWVFFCVWPYANTAAHRWHDNDYKGKVATRIALSRYLQV